MERAREFDAARSALSAVSRGINDGERKLAIERIASAICTCVAPTHEGSDYSRDVRADEDKAAYLAARLFEVRKRDPERYTIAAMREACETGTLAKSLDPSG